MSPLCQVCKFYQKLISISTYVNPILTASTLNLSTVAAEVIKYRALISSKNFMRMEYIYTGELLTEKSENILALVA